MLLEHLDMSPNDAVGCPKALFSCPYGISLLMLLQDSRLIRMQQSCKMMLAVFGYLCGLRPEGHL